MRTTLNIEDGVIAQAKHLAIERRTTLTALVEEALRELLARATVNEEFDLPVVNGGGFPEGYPSKGSEGKILQFLESLDA